MCAQAQLSAQQSRQQAMTAEAQLALSRQKLRQQVASGACPLAMSGWEDLVDEAAADLEKVEGHVAAAAQRLIELQVRARVYVYVLSTRKVQKRAKHAGMGRSGCQR
jgi:uncharacterized membrane-anchored protein YhcB (DUF1043 family)